VRLGKYLKAAFLNHWNLLAFLGAMAFGILTGRPDVALPLVAAGEITYLGMLGTHPKFQKYVDAQEAKQVRVKSAVTAEKMFERITRTLPPEALRRYEVLRQRCLDLRQIAQDLRSPGSRTTRLPLESLQLAGLDRLLWIYLRLLYTEWSLKRFLERTAKGQIEADIQRLEQRLSEFAPDDASPRKQKARKAVEDNLETSRGRLRNLTKAHENHELVQLEIDRLENKIRSLSEMAVNRQEPEFISDQVDSVATSMVETEKTMNELQFATGFGEVDEGVPELLARQTQLEG
jgi:hypothetical protein